MSFSVAILALSYGEGAHLHSLVLRYHGAPIPVGAGISFVQAYLEQKNFALDGDGTSNQVQVLEAFDVVRDTLLRFFKFIMLMTASGKAKLQNGQPLESPNHLRL